MEKVLPRDMDSPSDATDCWFDDPVADDRQSWAMPSAHGRYRGIELEFLDPADEDEADDVARGAAR